MSGHYEVRDGGFPPRWVEDGNAQKRFTVSEAIKIGNDFVKHFDSNPEISAEEWQEFKEKYFKDNFSLDINKQ